MIALSVILALKLSGDRGGGQESQRVEVAESSDVEVFHESEKDDVGALKQGDIATVDTRRNHRARLWSKDNDGGVARSSH